jgi:hypothetical protein
MAEHSDAAERIDEQMPPEEGTDVDQHDTDADLAENAEMPAPQRFSDTRALITVGFVILAALAGVGGWLGYPVYQDREAQAQRNLSTGRHGGNSWLPCPRISQRTSARDWSAMTDGKTSRLLAWAISIPIAVGPLIAAPVASADNSRLNNGVVVNVDTTKKHAGCTTDLHINPQLRAAAQRHTIDVLNNRGLDGDIGSDGSTVQDRARDAGYHGTVAETVAINQSFAINDLDVMGNWYSRPDYYAIMSNCANTQIGVWSENGPNRSVVVAVYGQPA